LLTSDPARNQVAPVFSPDGRLISYFSNLKGAENEAVWVANADGSHPVQLVRDDRIDIFPVWQADSQSVIYEAEALTPGETDDEYRSVSISGGAPQILMKHAPYRFFDVGRDGRILFRNGDQAQAFDPRTGKTQALGALNSAWGLSPIRWSPDQKSVAYVVAPTREADPDAGVWVTDFTNAPHQVFRGWVDWWIACGPGGELYFVQGKGDLKGVLAKVQWSGQGLTQTSTKIPMNYSYWIDPVQSSQDHFAISPDGRHVAFESQTVLSANIAMIEEK
jgi:dipeptidyl aminopeptidase/acylaminoacyl peptidase